MNWQIFFSTFDLIFLAELGDKTQLAAMARAATSESARWTIFLAASSALAFSTLIAVLFGSAITRVIPERYIKIGAACLFILFGLLILRDVFGKERVQAGASKTGGLTALVFREAAELETSAIKDYRLLAARARSADLKALLEGIADEEDAHFQRVTTVSHAHEDFRIPAGIEAALPAPGIPAHLADAEDRDIVQHALARETATANFYSELARLTPVSTLRKAFSTLAAAEHDHVARLRKFLDGEPA